MMKKYLLLIILSLLSKLSKCSEELKGNNSISKLISMVRTEIIDKSLQDLPYRKEVNFYKWLVKCNAKKEYSLNEEESAYLVFKWISNNIKINFSIEDLDDTLKVYNSGIGTTKSLCSLFNNFSYYLKVKSDSIPGYLKWANFYSYEITSNRNYTWNYIEIKGEFYLIDVSMASDLKDSHPEFVYLYFDTEPEIFIRSHFPKENK